MTTALKPHIRWATRRDIPDLLSLDRAASLGDAWNESRFLEVLRQRNAVAMVAELTTNWSSDDPDAITVGFVVWLLKPRQLDVLKLATPPGYQGKGVGSALLAKMRAKLTTHRRKFLTLPIGGEQWPLVCRPEWLTSDVRLFLAREEPAPLWLFAEALEEAGCTDPNWLDSFRRGGAWADELYAAFQASAERVLGEQST